MKYLLRALKTYRLQSVLAPLLKMAEATFDLLVPMVVAAIVNRGINAGDTGYVWRMGGLLLLMALVGLGFAVSAQYFAARAAIGSASSLRAARGSACSPSRSGRRFSASLKSRFSARRRMPPKSSRLVTAGISGVSSGTAGGVSSPSTI